MIEAYNYDRIKSQMLEKADKILATPGLKNVEITMKINLEEVPTMVYYVEQDFYVIDTQKGE